MTKERKKRSKTVRDQNRPSPGTIVTHWKPRITVRLTSDERLYSLSQLPLRYDIVPTKGPRNVQTRSYRPIFYSSDLYLRRYHYQYLSPNINTAIAKTTLKLIPTSVGVTRFLSNIEQTIDMMQSFGLDEEETDEVLQLLSPDRMYALALTYIVSLLHLIFSFLAFKNEVGFWVGVQDMGGLSSRAIIGRAVSSVIIFLYLYDSRASTSWLVTGTSAVSMIIDLWKVLRVLKFDWTLHRRTRSRKEILTDEIDAKAMRYLSYFLFPCVFGWAIYSLYAETYKGWWSWIIASAAKGVYAFGFLMMMPQIVINYKLKSVAHMPWRAMTYKAFNTFVDDVFAFMIEMPTTHRIATLRDDVVFFIYLFQRWIYPVDKKRANEFGYSYEMEAEDKKTI